MVHSLAGLNPTLPAWIGRVGPTANPIQNCPHNARTFETMWIFPPAMCVFLLGAAAVARGRIRKSQRNQSSKRYATDMRRKDLKSGGPARLARKNMTCHKPVLFPSKSINSQSGCRKLSYKLSGPTRPSACRGSAQQRERA